MCVPFEVNLIVRHGMKGQAPFIVFIKPCELFTGGSWLQSMLDATATLYPKGYPKVVVRADPSL